MCLTGFELDSFFHFKLQVSRFASLYVFLFFSDDFSAVVFLFFPSLETAQGVVSPDWGFVFKVSNSQVGGTYNCQSSQAGCEFNEFNWQLEVAEHLETWP